MEGKETETATFFLIQGNLIKTATSLKEKGLILKATTLFKASITTRVVLTNLTLNLKSLRSTSLISSTR